MGLVRKLKLFCFILRLVHSALSFLFHFFAEIKKSKIKINHEKNSLSFYFDKIKNIIVMQEINSRIIKENEEQIRINQIIRDYKLDFPCPHCDKRINDGHFDQTTRVFGYINEHIRTIVEKHFNFQENDYRQKWLKEMENNRTYENFLPVKELRKVVGELQQKISQLQSSEHIEKLERVRKLAEENNELRNQNQLLRDQSRINSKKKGELFEQYISEELSRVFDNKDKISKITQTGRKADFLQEVLTESNKSAGRIIYEAKDTEKWDNE